MAWLPIAQTVPQYENDGDPATGYVLKFYASGTSTPIQLATDSGGLTLADDVVLDSQGYPQISNSIFIPHIDQTYKLALYPTQAAADANSGSVWSQDALNAAVTTDTASQVIVSSNDTTSGYLNGKLTSGAGITLTEESDGGNETLKVDSKDKYYDTLILCVADVTNVSEGNVIDLTERIATYGGGFTGDVVANSGSENEFDLITLNGTLSLQMRFDNNSVDLAQLGGYAGVDMSEAINAMIQEPEVNHITNTGAISNIVLSTILEVDRSDLTLDLPDISYTGDYDLYAGGGSDRSVGVITVQGIQSASVLTTVSGAVTEGEGEYTFASVSGRTVGEDLRISNSDEVAYLVKILGISGSVVTLDYISGWDITAATISVYASTPVKNVHIKTGVITDTAQSSTADNSPSGISFLHAVDCSVDCKDTIGFLNPGIYTSYTKDFEVKRARSTKPRATGSGQGYVLQLNSAIRARGYNLSGVEVRHVMDFTRCAYCEFDLLHNIDGAAIGLITHGVYEHDIKVTRYRSYGAAGFFSLANAGVSFGERTKRFILEDARGDGSIHTVNAEDCQLIDVVVGGNASGSVRISPSTKLTGCEIATNGTFYFQGRLDRGTQKDMIIRNSILPDAEYKDFNIDILITDGSSIGWFENEAAATGTHDGAANAAVLTDTGASWVTDEHVGKIISNTTDGSTATITGNTATTITGTLSGGTDDDWDVSDAYSLPPHYPVNVRVKDSTINALMITTLTATGTVEITDCLTSSDTSSTGYGIRIAAPVILVNGGENINGTVISAEGTSVGLFSILGTMFHTPNSIKTSSTIRLRTQDDVRFIVKGINAENSSTGQLIETDRSDTSGINQLISGNVLKGNLEINDDNGGTVTSIITDNLVKATSDLPTPSATSIVDNNLQL